MPLMMYGEYTFEINTAAYQSLTRKSSYVWVEQKRLTQKPVLQFTGQTADAINLPGVIYPHFKGGLKQVDTLRTMAEKGEAHSLISGLGDLFGDFVIMDITEKQSVFTEEGAPLKIEFNLNLKEQPKAKADLSLAGLAGSASDVSGAIESNKEILSLVPGGSSVIAANDVAQVVV